MSELLNPRQRRDNEIQTQGVIRGIKIAKSMIDVENLRISDYLLTGLSDALHSHLCHLSIRLENIIKSYENSLLNLNCQQEE